MGITEADAQGLRHVLAAWSWVRPEWLHLTDGFTLLAMKEHEIVAFLSVRWLNLPKPREHATEGFIDIIEVREDCRRQGIARHLVEAAEARCVARGACQLRAWSSDDKLEAIRMWRSLGFALCPATEHFHGQSVCGFYVAKRFSQ